MAQLVKYVLCKHKNLSLESHIPHKKPGMLAHSCNPLAGKVLKDRYLELPDQGIVSSSSKNPCLKKKVQRNRGRHLPQPLASTYTKVCVHSHT